MDPSWIRVGDAAHWVKGRGRRVVVDGEPVAVFWDGASWTALDDTCPHMGASLADGRLFGGELQCSWHEWRYDRTTGQCPLRPWARVAVHEVRIDEGGVWIKRPEPSPPDAEPEGDPEWLGWDSERYFKKKSACQHKSLNDDAREVCHEFLAEKRVLDDSHAGDRVRGHSSVAVRRNT